MALGTKKRETNQPRTLAEMPEWQAAVAKQTELQTALAEAEQTARQGDDVSSPTERAGRIQTMADSILGKPVDTAETQLNRETATELVEAHKLAVSGHSHKMANLRSTLQGRLYEAWEDEHFAARKRIAENIVELKKAFDAEQELATRMAAAGAISSAVYGSRLLVNFGACANIPATIRGMKVKAFRRDNANLIGGK